MSFIVSNNPKTTPVTHAKALPKSPSNTTVATYYDYIVGIDTHARKHVYVLIKNTGELVGTGDCRVLEKDFHHLQLSIRRITENKKVLYAIEGTSGYGETLTHFLRKNGESICETKGMNRKARVGRGKSDLLDAESIARNILYLPLDKLAHPRIGDKRKLLRIGLSMRSNTVKQQTMDKHSLTALLRSIDIGIDARRPLGYIAFRAIAGTRPRSSDASHEAIARAEAKRLALSILDKAIILRDNASLLQQATEALAPGLLSLVGVGPVTGAQILCSYSHKGRIRSAAAFAKLAGVAPLPASSGNTVRHRLSRYGDRDLNCALNTIALNRMRLDEETKQYVTKRTVGGNSKREIKRILKRYIAREIFKFLERVEIAGGGG